jgi:hypothetical protein
MPNKVRDLISSALLITLSTTLLTACAPDRNVGPRANIQGGDPAPGVQSDLNVRRESAGIWTRPDLDQRLNLMKEVRGATVLIQGNNAYVGFINIGDEKTPDQAMQKRDTWQGMPYGTPDNPKSAAGMTVEQMEREGLPIASIHGGPGTTEIGNLSDDLKNKVADVVRAGAPEVRNVYITAHVDPVQKLSGYKHFIMRGGDMTRYKAEFESFLSRTFPR